MIQLKEIIYPYVVPPQYAGDTPNGDSSNSSEYERQPIALYTIVAVLLLFYLLAKPYHKSRQVIYLKYMYNI